MDNFTKNDMELLATEHEGFCLSIFMPTLEIEDKTKQNPIMLRGMVKKATDKMIEAGIKPTNARLIAEEIETVSYDTEFWLYSCTSLCIFASQEEFFLYRLPLTVKEQIFVSDHYYVLPLFELLENKDYYLITVDQAGVRFYLGNRFGLTDLTSEELRAKSISDIRSILEIEEIQSFRTENKRGRSKKHEDIIYHGHGNEKDDKKIRMNQFIESTIDLLPKALSEDKTPVVLAGNSEVVSYFKISYPYHNLLSQDLLVDTEMMDKTTLHAESWKIVEKTLNQEQEELKDKYCNQKATDLISNQLKKILPAAFYGKVDTLFVNTEEEEYGNFDPDTDSLIINRPPKPGDEELRNLTAIKVFNNKGRVVTFNSGRMADRTTLNAIYRY